jgi:hypothetical protein
MSYIKVFKSRSAPLYREFRISEPKKRGRYAFRFWVSIDFEDKQLSLITALDERLTEKREGGLLHRATVAKMSGFDVYKNTLKFQGYSVTAYHARIPADFCLGEISPDLGRLMSRFYDNLDMSNSGHALEFAFLSLRLGRKSCACLVVADLEHSEIFTEVVPW